MERTLPVFSIVIPTHDRPGQLAACLRSVIRLEYPRDRFEVIVVDDGSQVSPASVVTAFRVGVDVTLVSQAKGGPAAARNAGVARARGEFLAFTDDDCAPAPDWLRALAARFAAAPGHAIGGRTTNVLGRNHFSTATQLLLAYLSEYYNADPDHARFFPAMNLAFPAGRFRAVGAFDARYPLAAAEDRDLCRRWRAHGYRLTYAPEAVVRHAHPLTLRSFWRQHGNYGRGARRLRAGGTERAPARLLPEPPSFYFDLLRYPLTQARGRRRWLLAALLGVAQIATGAGYLHEWLVGGRGPCRRST